VEQGSRALRRLTLETRAHHAAADEGWLRLLAPDVTRRDYIGQLITTYGFEGPLEAALAYTPNLKLLVDLRQRFRAGLLAQDLLALGIKAAGVANLPQCLPIAPFTAPIEALGWLYVVERSTLLLHESTARHLRARVADIQDACAYLTVYDGESERRWAELGEVLDRTARTDRLLDDMIAAAHSGFRCLIAWSSDHRLSVARGA
jgi:heme oxygenase